MSFSIYRYILPAVHIFGLLLYGIAMLIVIRKNKYLRKQKEGGNVMPEKKMKIVCEIHTDLPQRIINYIINDGNISGAEKILLFGSDIKVKNIDITESEVLTRE